MHNLPSLHSNFIGRQEELSNISALIESKRLVTITGIGGIGKSRLAIQVASRLSPHFQDGVCYLSLIPLDSPDMLGSSLLNALSIPFAGQETPKEHLLNMLRDREMLLVLDNFEHLLPDTDLVADILQQTDGVSILATSREKLNLKGEVIFSIGGLSLPGDSEGEIADTYDAMQLLRQSAHRVCPDFSFNDQNRKAAMRICRLVDGMALALELAGAWVRALSCDEISAEIESSLDFLSATWTDQSERHRSLRAIFEHSWAMLDSEEQQVFQQLSVFSGGFDREASRQVTQASTSVLASLLDRSFLAWDPIRERYDLHPVLKHYAEDKLAEDPENAARIRNLHCSYFCTFLKERGSGSEKKAISQALREIDVELANIYSAWQYAASKGEVDYLDDSKNALYRFFATRSRDVKGISLFSSTIEKLESRQEIFPRGERLTHKLRARRASMLYRLGRVNDAEQELLICLQVAQRSTDRPEAVFCRLGLGLVRASQVDSSEAKQLLNVALDEAIDLGLQWEESIGHRYFAIVVLLEGSYALAQEHLERSLQLCRKGRDRCNEGSALRNLGVVARCQGATKKAKEYIEQAIIAHQEIGDIRGEGCALSDLGLLAVTLRRYTRALEAFERELMLMHRAGDRRAETSALEYIGFTYTWLGDYERSREYLSHVLKVSRVRGWLPLEHDALCSLGKLMVQQGNYGEAEGFNQAALEIECNSGSLQSMRASTLTSLGEALIGQGRLKEAETVLQEAVTIRKEIGQEHLLSSALANLASIELIRGNNDEALRIVEHLLPEIEDEEFGGEEFGSLYWVCYQVLKAVDDPRAETVLRIAQNTLQLVAALIDDEDLRSSFLENIPSHHAIMQAYGRQEQHIPSTALAEPLTPQETEILRLIADGLTNRDIAERLVITVGTVKIHTHNLYGKLRVKNRTQAVAHARELGFL